MKWQFDIFNNPEEVSEFLNRLGIGVALIAKITFDGQYFYIFYPVKIG